MSKNDPIVIVSAVRSPLGRFLGAIAGLSAPALGGEIIRSAMSRVGLSGDSVDEVLTGCVLPAGQGQAPARQAARYRTPGSDRSGDSKQSLWLRNEIRHACTRSYRCRIGADSYSRGYGKHVERSVPSLQGEDGLSHGA